MNISHICAACFQNVSISGTLLPQYWSFLSPLLWKWDNSLFWFSLLYCTATTYFHRFALPPGVGFQNEFCSKSRLKCSWFPDFKPSFLKIGVDGHSTLQYSGDDMLSGHTLLCFDGGGTATIYVWDSINYTCRQMGNHPSMFYVASQEIGRAVITIGC
jgi:hypothetical protein